MSRFALPLANCCSVSKRVQIPIKTATDSDTKTADGAGTETG